MGAGSDLPSQAQGGAGRVSGTGGDLWDRAVSGAVRGAGAGESNSSYWLGTVAIDARCCLFISKSQLNVSKEIFFGVELIGLG